MSDEPPFWESKSLDEMTPDEWEALCDGCGKCCLHVFEDPDTSERFRASVACRLLDTHTCRCADYEARFEHVPGCVRVTVELARNGEWLPSTCAYRLLARGESLRWWHPLVSGDPETVHLAGISVRDRVISGEGMEADEMLEFPDFPDE
jgi:uncharacterized cysteine cluster protein YcgN (CxxCxxCC family)